MTTCNILYADQGVDATVVYGFWGNRVSFGSNLIKNDTSVLSQPILT